VTKWSGRPATRLRKVVLQRDRGICHLCGRAGATTVDHLVPQSMGGSSELVNLMAAHSYCNTARGAKVIMRSRPSREW
jgi:5-methylcytosine-specific restriction endonuclease McrA